MINQERHTPQPPNSIISTRKPPGCRGSAFVTLRVVHEADQRRGRKRKFANESKRQHQKLADDMEHQTQLALLRPVYAVLGRDTSTGIGVRTLQPGECDVEAVKASRLLVQQRLRAAAVRGLKQKMSTGPEIELDALLYCSHLTASQVTRICKESDAMSRVPLPAGFSRTIQRRRLTLLQSGTAFSTSEHCKADKSNCSYVVMETTTGKLWDQKLVQLENQIEYLVQHQQRRRADGAELRTIEVVSLAGLAVRPSLKHHLVDRIFALWGSAETRDSIADALPNVSALYLAGRLFVLENDPTSLGSVMSLTSASAAGIKHEIEDLRETMATKKDLAALARKADENNRMLRQLMSRLGADVAALMGSGDAGEVV